MEIIPDGEMFSLHNADCIQHMQTMPEACVDFSCYSPPFPQTFAYTDLESDLGNSENLHGEAPLHFSFFYRAIRRILKPGRVMVVHVSQIHRSKRNGEQGIFDFRGLNIRLAERAGFVFEYDWVIRKNPQAQALRGKKIELKFQGLERDRTVSRGAMPDYLLKFRAPGTNAVQVTDKVDVSDDFTIQPQVTRNDWIKFAECCWMDIQESDTLNAAEGRSENDIKHIAPLQLEVIRRLILLYTNPGEIVFSPFMGIGSEGFVALGGASPKTKRRIFDQRRFYGVELKPEYFAAAQKNMLRAIRDFQAQQKSLFDDIPTEIPECSPEQAAEAT